MSTPHYKVMRGRGYAVIRSPLGHDTVVTSAERISRSVLLALVNEVEDEMPTGVSCVREVIGEARDHAH